MLRTATRASAALRSQFGQQQQQPLQMSIRAMSSIRFTKDHEYVKVQGKIGTCGITNHAQTLLGDVVYVSLPEVGVSFKKGESMASVESVKAASDVYAPVSGKIVEINKVLSDTPAKVNESAEGDAWFVKIELSDAGEVNSMMEAAAYKKHCDDSKH